MSALGHALLLAFLAVLSQHAAVADVQTCAVSPACDGDSPQQRAHKPAKTERRHALVVVALAKPASGIRTTNVERPALPAERTVSAKVVTPQKPGAPRGPPPQV